MRRDAERRERDAALALALDDLTGSSKRLDEARAIADKLVAELEMERHASASLRLVVTTAQKERDQWMELYHRQSIESGAAQAMMWEQIGSLGRQLRARGVEPRIDPRVEQVVEAFERDHVGPSKDVIGKAVELVRTSGAQ